LARGKIENARGESDGLAKIWIEKTEDLVIKTTNTDPVVRAKGKNEKAPRVEHD